jgi:hypothetical protein
MRPSILVSAAPHQQSWTTLGDCATIPFVKRRDTILGKRREPRLLAKLHVRISGIDASGRPILLMVPTLNVSRQGALLEGIQARLKVGDSVAITYKTSKARFRVTWVGDAQRAGQIGVQIVETEKCIWDATALPPMAADIYLAPPVKERKGSP